MLRDTIPEKPADFEDESDVELNPDIEAERERKAESRQQQFGEKVDQLMDLNAV